MVSLWLSCPSTTSSPHNSRSTTGSPSSLLLAQQQLSLACFSFIKRLNLPMHMLTGTSVLLLFFLLSSSSFCKLYSFRRWRKQLEVARSSSAWPNPETHSLQIWLVPSTSLGKIKTLRNVALRLFPGVTMIFKPFSTASTKISAGITERQPGHLLLQSSTSSSGSTGFSSSSLRTLPSSTIRTSSQQRHGVITPPPTIHSREWLNQAKISK